MASTIAVSERRRRRSGGNVIIESAFTFLPTFALVFAMTDFGLMMFRWATLQNAVREATRYAVTFQTQAGFGQDASIKNMVQQYSMGLVRTTDSPQHIFVDYFAPTNLTTPYGSGGNLPGNVVVVSVKNVSFAWLAPLSGGFGAGIPIFGNRSPLTLQLTSADILGGYPVGVNSVAR
jgi:Flp pilus assembly protein TadG